VYGREAPFALDIGFGAGCFLLGLARQHPEWNVLGLEIRQAWVDRVLHEAQGQDLRNVHALLANANLHLEDLLPRESVAFVAINFPDPWFKKRHHKRRVVQAQWLDMLETRLKPGAEIHAMSDYEPIAVEIRERLDERPNLINTAGMARFAEQSTTGITTEREQKHQGRGESIYRMRFIYEPNKNDVANTAAGSEMHGVGDGVATHESRSGTYLSS
jgi:tRNA (guanine-N7-)-methyltransferase